MLEEDIIFLQICIKSLQYLIVPVMNKVILVLLLNPEEWVSSRHYLFSFTSLVFHPKKWVSRCVHAPPGASLRLFPYFADIEIL